MMQATDQNDEVERLPLGIELCGVLPLDTLAGMQRPGVLDHVLAVVEP